MSSRSSGDTSMWCLGLTGSPTVETAKRYSHWLVKHIFLVNHARGPACGSNQSSCVAIAARAVLIVNWTMVDVHYGVDLA